MSTIRKRFKVDSVLTDPTSIVLSDSTGTYGVKRDDTGAAVVAAGTAMTQISTGDYQHQFTDPANDLTYTYCVKIVYGGATYYFAGELTGPTTLPTLLTTLQRLAEVDAAITECLEAQSAGFDDKTVTRAQLATLYKMRKELQAKLDRENGVSAHVGVPDMRGNF